MEGEDMETFGREDLSSTFQTVQSKSGRPLRKCRLNIPKVVENSDGNDDDSDNDDGWYGDDAPKSKRSKVSFSSDDDDDEWQLAKSSEEDADSIDGVMVDDNLNKLPSRRSEGDKFIIIENVNFRREYRNKSIKKPKKGTENVAPKMSASVKKKVGVGKKRKKATAEETYRGADESIVKNEIFIDQTMNSNSNIDVNSMDDGSLTFEDGGTVHTLPMNKDDLSTSSVLKVLMKRFTFRNSLASGDTLFMLQVPCDQKELATLIAPAKCAFRKSKKGDWQVKESLLRTALHLCTHMNRVYFVIACIKRLSAMLSIEGRILIELNPNAPKNQTNLTLTDFTKMTSDINMPHLPDKVVLDLSRLHDVLSNSKLDRPLITSMQTVFQTVWLPVKAPPSGTYLLKVISEPTQVKNETCSIVSVICGSRLEQIPVTVCMDKAELNTELEKRGLHESLEQHIVIIWKRRGVDQPTMHSVPELLQRSYSDVQFIDRDEMIFFLKRLGAKTGDQVIVCTGKLLLSVVNEDFSRYRLGPSLLTNGHSVAETETKDNRSDVTANYSTTGVQMDDISDLQSLPSSIATWNCSTVQCYSFYTERTDGPPCRLELLLSPVAVLDLPEAVDCEDGNKTCTWCGPRYLSRCRIGKSVVTEESGLGQGCILSSIAKSKKCFCGYEVDGPIIQDNYTHFADCHSQLFVSGYFNCTHKNCNLISISTHDILNHHFQESHVKKMANMDEKIWNERRAVEVKRILKDRELLMDLRIESCEDWTFTWNFPAKIVMEGQIFRYDRLERIEPTLSHGVGERVCGLCGVPQTDHHHRLCHDGVKVAHYWRCSQCQATFASVRAFIVHGPCVRGKVNCAVCYYSTSLNSRTYVEQHLHDAAVHDVAYHGPRSTNHTAVYRCRHCPRSFTAENELRRHIVGHEVCLMRKRVERKRYDCSVCHFSYTNEASRDFHQSLHKDLKCPKCDLQYSQIDALQQHISACHVRKDFRSIHQRCCFCGVSKIDGSLPASLYEKRCEDDHHITTKCRFCKATFKFQTQLARHLSIVHHEPRKTYCVRCDLWFPTRYLLMVHLKTKCLSLKTHRFCCVYCGVRFTRRMQLCRHKRKRHSDIGRSDSYVCRVFKKKAKSSSVSSHKSKCPSCEKTFCSSLQLRLHQRLLHKTSVHKCSICSLSFRSDAMRQNHERCYHGAMLFRCHVCSVQLRSRFGLRTHLIDMHHHFYKCNVCAVSYEFVQDLEQHTSMHSAECKKCSQLHHLNGETTCSSKMQRRAAVLRERENKKSASSVEALELECNVCALSFRSKMDTIHLYESHWSQHTSGFVSSASCPCCEYTTTEGFGDIHRHMTDEHPDKFHLCPKCRLHFIDEETLLFHQRYCRLTSFWQLAIIKDLKRNVYCEECNILFADCFLASEHYLKNHGVNTNWVGYSCVFCGAVYQTDRGYKEHLVKHANYNWRRSCPHCSYVGAKMTYHMKSCHSVTRSHPQTNRLVACPHCPKKISKYLLGAHLLSHGRPLAKDAFIVCDHCGKEIYRNLMCTHVKLHRERKFKCEKCGDKFKLKVHLLNHLKIHEPKKFACKECDVKFRLRHHLESHERSFHGRKGYKCKDCGVEFKLRWKRTKHRRQKHNAVCGISSESGDD